MNSLAHPALPQLTRHPKALPWLWGGGAGHSTDPKSVLPACPWVSHWNIFYRLETIIKTRFKVQSCFGRESPGQPGGLR